MSSFQHKATTVIIQIYVKIFSWKWDISSVLIYAFNAINLALSTSLAVSHIFENCEGKLWFPLIQCGFIFVWTLSYFQLLFYSVLGLWYMSQYKNKNRNITTMWFLGSQGPYLIFLLLTFQGLLMTAIYISSRVFICI